MNTYIPKINWSKKKILITGHTGFKGSWLSLIFTLLGANIYGYSLKPRRKDIFYTKLKKKINFNKEKFNDICNLNSLSDFVKKSDPDLIIHLAAQPLVSSSYENSKDTIYSNVIGTMNVLEAIKKNNVHNNLIITSDKVYEPSTRKIFFKEIDPLGGNDIYSASKAMSEILTKSYYESFFDDKKIKIITARSGNIIGGGDWSENRIVPDYFRAFFNKKTLIIRQPKYVRPWQHILDPLVGYISSAEKMLKSKKSQFDNYNFGPHKKNIVKVEDLIVILNKINSNVVKINYKKNNSLKETNILNLDSSKSMKNLKWKQEIDILSGLKFTNDWYLINHFGALDELYKITVEQIEKRIKI